MQNFSYVRTLRSSCVVSWCSSLSLVQIHPRNLRKRTRSMTDQMRKTIYIYIHWKRGERPVTMRVTLFLPGMSSAPKEWKACMNHSLCYVLALLCHKILLTVKISNNEIKLNAQIFSMKFFFFFFLFCSVRHQTPTSIVSAW